MGNPSTPDIAWPDRDRLQDLLARFKTGQGQVLSPDDVAELTEAINFTLGAVDPAVDYTLIATRNPMHKVFFRAGLLAAREHIARMIDGYMVGGPIEIARTVRATWWPVLGPDPGPPRLFQFDEIAAEVTRPDGSVGIDSKDIDASIEALPRALQFVEGITCNDR